MDTSADIQHLQIAFRFTDQTIMAVDDLNFSLLPGKTLALLGESGCGKSLTALGLMRLLPHGGVYGINSQIKLGEDDLINLPEWMMRQFRGRRLAMIFQEPMTALNPVLNIGDQLAETIKRNAKLSHEALREKLISLLQKVELSEPLLRLSQYPHQLSGGQKQRVVIAMALANNPDILIADEPTTALDVSIQAQILSLLKKLQQEHQMAMLLITHDIGIVKATADFVAVMYAGQLVEMASVHDFFKVVKHPYAQQLLASLPDFSKRTHALQNIPGIVPTLGQFPSACRFHPRCAHAFSRCSIEEPLLQVVDEQTVRCHLYPEHKALPPLVHTEKPWLIAKEVKESPVLQAVDLHVYFSSPSSVFKRKLPLVKAVEGVSFFLHPGQTLALVGESGSGKTTVGRALLQLLPISSGDIYYRGKNLTDLKGRERRHFKKRVQIIFQDPYSSMNPRMTVGQIIGEGMQSLGLSNQERLNKQLQLLDQVHLPQTSLTRYPHQFSGGQRQRICIARAMAAGPEIIICDEPTSALDISVQAQILNLLKTLQIELGIAYLFITHNMAVVSYLADDVLVMRHGQVIETGTALQILKTPQHPYTKMLLQSVLKV